MTTTFHGARARIGYDALLSKLTDEEVSYRKAEYKTAFYDESEEKKPVDDEVFRLLQVGREWFIQKRVWFFFWKPIEKGNLFRHERVKELFVYSGHFSFTIENPISGHRFVKNVNRP